MEEGVKQFYRQNGIPPGVPTQKGSNADPYVTGIALPNVPLGNYDVPSGWPTNVKFNEPGDVPGPPVQFESDEMGDPGAGYGFESDRTYEGDWFFFHTDHLGSTSYLTDTAGNVSQFVCYTPYGEAIVDEHLTTYENPFKFSGKELDDITGLYDHGARSRNPISTLWYGVDPLWEKYPEMGPYVYCAGNPVKFLDMDGRDLYEVEGETGNIKRTKNDDNQDTFVITDSEGNRQTDFDDNELVKSYPKGQVEFYEDEKASKENIDIFSIKDENVASDLFRFFADNTNVEWSHCNDGDDDVSNFVSTSHKRKADCSFNFLYNNKIVNSVNYQKHNHPQGLPWPSGLEKNAQRGDIEFARIYSEKFPRIKFYIYVSRNGGTEFEFSKDSKRTDFPKTKFF